MPGNREIHAPKTPLGKFNSTNKTGMVLFMLTDKTTVATIRFRCECSVDYVWDVTP